jgi:hypothetical protein
MSIWCSGEHIGTDPTVMYEAGDGLYEVDLGDGKAARGREPVEQKPERGNVISYANGFSNHYPDLTGTHERPACIGLATIPEWCVPGHDESGNYDLLGPWLRLEVAAPETLNFWIKTDDGEPVVESEGATVLLDEEAVRSLRDDLSRWLERPKAQPVTKPNQNR